MIVGDLETTSARIRAAGCGANVTDEPFAVRLITQVSHALQPYLLTSKHVKVTRKICQKLRNSITSIAVYFLYTTKKCRRSNTCLVAGFYLVMETAQTLSLILIALATLDGTAKHAASTSTNARPTPACMGHAQTW